MGGRLGARTPVTVSPSHPDSAVMAKLVALVSQCDADSSISAGDSIPSNLETPIVTASSAEHFLPCHCKLSLQCAKRLKNVGRDCRFGVKRPDILLPRMQVSMPHTLLIHLDIRLKNPVPRLFLLVPFAMKTAMKSPQTWLRRISDEV